MTPLYYCPFFFIISPRMVAWTFISTNFYSIHPRMICIKFDLNWPCGSGKELENEKSLLIDRQMTDKRRSKKLRWAKIRAWWKDHGKLNKHEYRLPACLWVAYQIWDLLHHTMPWTLKMRGLKFHFDLIFHRPST